MLATKIVVTVLASIFVLALLVGEIRTITVNRDAKQKLFLAGTVPSPLPDGTYQGQVNAYHGGWQGKTFNLAAKTGFNNFSGRQVYPFKFYQGQSLSGPTQVIKIDYNVSPNAWWLRHLVDEVVQTAPNHLLGKLNVRWAGLTFSLGFFTLEK